MAEILSDAIGDVTGVRETFSELALNDGSTEKVTGYAEGTRALQLHDSAVKNPFLKVFGRNARDITCECERSNQPSLVQVLNLANGSTINDKLAAKESRVTQLLATDPTPEKIVEEAWITCLSRRPSDAERKTQAEQALAYARRAVELAPENAVNVLSLAICYGKMGVYGDTRAKIDYSRLVKIEAERAAALDPNYDWAQHVLGRWHYEVADLGVAKRFFVRLIYGGLPAASFEEAIRRLERAVALAPNRVPHHLELGFAFLAAGRVADARASFARGLALPSTELYDESSKQRAREALARF
jgi:tetratricopeptide (TPR) repeat protein